MGAAVRRVKWHHRLRHHRRLKTEPGHILGLPAALASCSRAQQLVHPFELLLVGANDQMAQDVGRQIDVALDFRKLRSIRSLRNVGRWLPLGPAC